MMQRVYPRVNRRDVDEPVHRVEVELAVDRGCENMTTISTGCLAQVNSGICPFAPSQNVNTSYAVAIGTPLTSVRKMFSRFWPPNMKRLLSRGQRALYLKRMSCAFFIYSRRCHNPYQAPTMTTFRTSISATQPMLKVRIVAIEGVATHQAASAVRK
jgi:hypothetical protein